MIIFLIATIGLVIFTSVATEKLIERMQEK